MRAPLDVGGSWMGIQRVSNRRFRIALSFAGDEAEFAIYNLGIRLPVLYGEQSDLFVPVLCPDYDQKRWTGWEWMHIFGLLNRDDGHRVMPCRFEHAHADGLSPAAGFIELTTQCLAVMCRGRWSERGSECEGFRSNRKLPRGRRQSPDHANLPGRMEAPPGFEPGMEVLQIPHCSVSC
ncbi:MAG: hypothetical protein ABIT71_04415 [Vicinamibacteraceae bacterium]